MKNVCPSCKNAYDAGEAFCPEDGTRLVSQSQLGRNPIANDPLVGHVLAERWKLIRPIGSGGMGVVYEAHHTTLAKRVAVKVLRAQVSADADVVERFQREARSASLIGHENIIEIIDFGRTAGGASFMVMELLEGQDLADRLLHTGPMELEVALPIVLQCCRALGAAHDKGIVHRDMKPENVFLIRSGDREDFVKIVDFGIAKMNDLETPGAPGRKLTKTGMIFGTPEYMSTEQAYGRPTDQRSDIYGLGVITHELLTGTVPFQGETFMAVISQHMLDEPPRMAKSNPQRSYDEELEAIVARSMAKEPADRFQSMAEFHDALLAYAEKKGIGTPKEARMSLGPAPAAPESPSPSAPLRPVAARPTPRRPDETAGSLKLRLEDALEGPRSRGTGAGSWAMILAALVVVGGGIGAVAVMKPELFGSSDVPGTATPVDPIAFEAEPGRDAGLPEPLDGAAEASSPAAVEEATVEVRVETTPPRATARAGEEHCRPTPCSLSLPADGTTTIEVEFQGRTAEATVVPGEQQGSVRITIPRRGAGHTVRPPAMDQGASHTTTQTGSGSALPTETHEATANDLH